MKVIVTGATGFVGSHLARLLLEEGCDVHALIRKTSDTWRISDILDSLHVVKGDLLQLGDIEQQLRQIGPEMCFHLAWYAVPGKYLTSEENLKMLTASASFASLVSKLGCKRFIGVGTCLEYDTSLGYLSESCPVGPRSLYAASKLALRYVLEQLSVSAEMTFAWPRLFYVYGPFESPQRLVPYVVTSLVSGKGVEISGNQNVRDYLHVEDVAAALWAVAKSPVGGPVNVGSGKPVTVQDIAARIGEIMGRKDLIGTRATSDSQPPFICANNSMLKERTGWRPKYDVERGLRQTIDWWKGRLAAI